MKRHNIQNLALSAAYLFSSKILFKFSCSNLICAAISRSSCIRKLLPCSVMKSCKRGKSEKIFDATCFCLRGNFFRNVLPQRYDRKLQIYGMTGKFCYDRKGMTVKFCCRGMTVNYMTVNLQITSLLAIVV